MRKRNLDAVRLCVYYWGLTDLSVKLPLVLSILKHLEIFLPNNLHYFIKHILRSHLRKYFEIHVFFLLIFKEILPFQKCITLT